MTICAYASSMSKSALGSCTLSAMHLPDENTTMSRQTVRTELHVMCELCPRFIAWMGLIQPAGFSLFFLRCTRWSNQDYALLTSIEQVLCDSVWPSNLQMPNVSRSATTCKSLPHEPPNPPNQGIQLYCTSIPPLVEIPGIAPHLIMQYLRYKSIWYNVFLTAIMHNA